MRRRLLSLLLTLAAFVGVIVANTGTAHADAPILMKAIYYGRYYNTQVDIWSNQGWFVGTNLNGTVTYVTFQSDINPVIYTSGHPAWWATNHYSTGSPPWALTFYNNMCLNQEEYYSGSWHVVWTAVTFGNQLQRCDSIPFG
jgi:hypothetical protein